MHKTAKWSKFVQQQITPEESHRLATAPLPAVRICVPTHSAHAMGRRSGNHEIDESNYAAMKGDR